MNRRGPLLAGAAVVAVAALGAVTMLAVRALGPEEVSVAEPAHAVQPPVPPAPEERTARVSVATVTLARDETLPHALARLELSAEQSQAVLGALTGKLPFDRMRPGDQLRLERMEGDPALRRLTYRQGRAAEWIVTAGDGGLLRAERRQIAVSTETARIEVEIRGSLWESLERAGEDPSLAVLVADVLAWDVDFYADVRARDRMKVVVQKVEADGKLLRYGEILGAEYAGAVTGTKRIFRYVDPHGALGYFDDAGNSARRGFLKSPLKYAHLTSGFGRRVHPVLGFVKAHRGVDYGAPVGTPVWAMGDGTVEQAGWNGGCGKSVILRHRNGLETVYCHLSSVLVRTGARVAQKQVVGKVGQTGLATGPHLHLGVKRGGAFVNPASLKVPREAPLPKEQRAAFHAAVAPVRALLDGTPVAAGGPPADPAGSGSLPPAASGPGIEPTVAVAAPSRR